MTDAASPPSIMPLVSVVMPSFNQGRFISEAIDSVLEQSYPDIELWVVDAGSSDGTLQILEGYGDRIRWLSETDRGQSEAINKGFRRATGEIFCWLNADDRYLPSAIERAVDVLDRDQQVGLVYGRGLIIDEGGEVQGEFREIEHLCLWRLLHVLDYILQPATFFRRSAFERVAGLNETLHYGMDWDLWIRLALKTEVLFLDELLACSRVHANTKTNTGGWPRIRELGRLVKGHTGRFWTPGLRLYALDELDRYFKRNTPDSLHRRVEWVRHGLSRRIVARLPKHADGWLGPRSTLLVPRHWPGVELELFVPRLPRRGSLSIVLESDDSSREISVKNTGSTRVQLALSGRDKRGFAAISVRCDSSFVEPDTSRRLAVQCREMVRIAV